MFPFISEIFSTRFESLALSIKSGLHKREKKKQMGKKSLMKSIHSESYCSSPAILYHNQQFTIQSSEFFIQKIYIIYFHSLFSFYLIVTSIIFLSLSYAQMPSTVPSTYSMIFWLSQDYLSAIARNHFIIGFIS